MARLVGYRGYIHAYLGMARLVGSLTGPYIQSGLFRLRICRMRANNIESLLLRFTGPPVPITARVHSAPRM
eukprot:7790619-Pyramimonas_sp.AAC.1